VVVGAPPTVVTGGGGGGGGAAGGWWGLGAAGGRVAPGLKVTLTVSACFVPSVFWTLLLPLVSVTLWVSVGGAGRGGAGRGAGRGAGGADWTVVGRESQALGSVAGSPVHWVTWIDGEPPATALEVSAQAHRATHVAISASGAKPKAGCAVRRPLRDPLVP
jgi:hypothetical protein